MTKPTIRTISDYPSQTDSQNFAIPDRGPRVASNDPLPSSSPVIHFEWKANCCSPCGGLVLLIIGLTLTIIGSLSLLSFKYPALSALSMTPEVGVGMVILGAVTSTVAGFLIKREISKKNESVNGTYPGNGHRLGSETTSPLAGCCLGKCLQ